MIFSFDYYHNLVDVDLYLCNPDGRELFPLKGMNRKLILRFNDLSELTFDAYPTTTLSDGTEVYLEMYDYLETKRLIYATDIGWFQIARIDENDNGIVKYKTVTAESHQAIFKNKGVTTEERVYCFYNPADPYDDYYDSSDENSIPSVVGQMCNQLGINLDLKDYGEESVNPYDDWTITYINNSLHYDNEKKICRTFKEETVYGYDWMVNTVEDAFEVAIIFDFLNKKIEVKTAEEVTKDKANVLYSFNNFMKEIKVEEDASEIITVLNCNGNNCNITNVNPTGTNYICDFSYYMDKAKQRWMSLELIDKLETWKADCETKKGEYIAKISELLAEQEKKTKVEAQLQEMSLSLQELKNAQLERGIIHTGKAEDAGKKCGIVLAEHVEAGLASIDEASYYYWYNFIPDLPDMYFPPEDRRIPFIAYDDKASDGKSALNYNESTSQWEFASNGLTETDTPNNLVASNTSDDNKGSSIAYEYFPDPYDKTCYCVLTKASKVDTSGDEPKAINYCTGFDRYIALVHPTTGGGVTTYNDKLQYWINLKEAKVAELNKTKDALDAQIEVINEALENISSALNIFNYFSDSPELLRELNQYWIEGDYTNENIAVLDNTTHEEAIDLANELMESGYVELSKVCQPRYSFTLNSFDAIKCYEFRTQMSELELGKIITIEKEENLWYYPALLEVNINLDSRDDFSMTFANAMRLDDWGYTYADLITDVSATSRKVNSNWQDILKYAKEKETIDPLIKNPLDMTLRASFANMVNQEFTIDDHGILGRKFKSPESEEFEDEQVRLINNLLVFTSDNWQTARAALGRIYYGDTDNPTTAYGLIADTIIGTLMMSETLSIKNNNSTIQLDANGIVIKKADGTEVFKAGVDGSLVVNNYVTSGDFKALETQLSLVPGQISASVRGKLNAEDGDWTTFGWTIDTTAFTIWNNSAAVFRASKEGIYVNGNGTFTGTIYAGGGDIGGWHIGGTYLGYSSDAKSFYISSGSDDSGYWIRAHNTNNGVSTMPFAITDAGILYATGAVISGTITAGAGSNIGGFTITGNSLYSNSHSYIGDTNYAGVYLGQDGLDILGSGGNGYLRINVDTGVLECKGTIIATSGQIGYWYVSTGKLIGYTNYGAYNQHTVVFDVEKGLGWSPELGETIYYADWENIYRVVNGLAPYALEGANSESDKLIKNSIGNFDDRYDMLFDNIKPQKYKYNEGTSDRYHTGFIAQDVAEAVTAAGLTLKDFAAVIKLKEPTDRGSEWLLRRDEFVALNTWQIQKLKARVTELEKMIAELSR